MSVAGGSWKEGNWLASAGFCGPGSSRLVRLFPLILPCGGESGLPNVAADAAADMPRAAADAAAPSRISRRDKPFIGDLTGYLGDGQCCGLPFPRNFGGLAQDYVCNIVWRATANSAAQPASSVGGCILAKILHEPARYFDRRTDSVG